MNYAIQYHDITGDWLIFDISDGFELVGIHSSEKDARHHTNQLERDFARRAQWTREPICEAA